MLTSLDQLFELHSLNGDERIRMKKVCKPLQYVFISLIQYFGSDKMLKLDIKQWNDNHRLIPYGNNIYGVYAVHGYKIFNSNGSLNTTFDGNRADFNNPIMIVKFNKEEYNIAKEEYDKFWQWRNNRNPTRMAMEESFNFDGKHAMHLVRLLRMGVEALRDEEIVVKRPDALELLEIRGGAWTYEEIVAYAEKMDKEVREVWYKKTNLPKRPDLKFAAALLMDVQDLVWNG